MATTPKPHKQATPKSSKSRLRKVTANLSGSSRVDKLHGREHLVLPVRMIVPGVLNGSNGPLLYPPSEVGRDPHDWNGMPIVIQHPTDKDGRPISARSARVLNKSGIGVVLESRFGKTLDAEAWFDIEKLIKVNKPLYDRLAAGEPVELSTGLWTQNEPREGVYRNKPYTHIARNYKPDHLAILPNEKGACSNNDGCGVNVNRRSKKNTPSRNKSNSSVRGENQMARKLRPEVKKRYIDNLIGNCDCAKKEEAISEGPWTEADRATLNKMPDEKLVQLEKARVAQVSNARIAAIAAKGFVDGNATFAFNAETGTFDKKVKKTKTVNKVTDPEDDEDGEVEEEPIVNKKAGKKARLTENEFLELMPASMKEDIQFARNERTKQKDALIKVITANKANVFKVDYLKGKDIEELTALAALAGPATNKEGASNSRFTRQPKFGGNYAGAAGAFGGDELTENEEEYEEEDDLVDDEPLDIPTLNWEEISKENRAKA